MRLILATLSFFIALAALFGVYIWLAPPDAPGWLTTVVGMIAIVLSLVITNRFVNAPGTNFWSLAKAPEPMVQFGLESLIAATEYRAVRCFTVVESREEGPHYFIELADKTVLYLNGRYLAAYEPHKFLGLINSPRKFPCTEFTVRRDRYEGGVVGIQCRGTVFEPELTLPAFKEAELESLMLLKDGEVIASRTYDDLKGRRSSFAASDTSARAD